MKGDPLTAQTPGKTENGSYATMLLCYGQTEKHLSLEVAHITELTHLKWKKIAREMRREVRDSPCPMRAR